jgi:hypothetical protein
MRHIAQNKIVSITADSEDSNFPVSRLLDEHPKRQWKAASGVNSATLTADVVGGCSDIMISGTNAASAEVVVSDPNAIDWEAGIDWETGVEWASLPGALTASVIQRGQSQSLWIQLSNSVEIPCEVSIELTGPGGEAVCAGVVVAAIADTYGGRNPSYGMEHTRIDFGITAENSNGSFYYKKRDNVREFSVGGIALRSDAIRLLDTFDSLGSNPSAWKLTNADGNDFVIFGRYSESPQVNHIYYSHSEFSFSLIEVL